MIRSSPVRFVLNGLPLSQLDSFRGNYVADAPYAQQKQNIGVRPYNLHIETLCPGISTYRA